MNRLKGEQWFWLEPGIFRPERSTETLSVLCDAFLFPPRLWIFFPVRNEEVSHSCP